MQFLRLKRASKQREKKTHDATLADVRRVPSQGATYNHTAFSKWSVSKQKTTTSWGGRTIAIPAFEAAAAALNKKKRKFKHTQPKRGAIARGVRRARILQSHAFTQEGLRTNYSRHFVQIRKSRISKASQGRARKKARSKHKKFCGELKVAHDTTRFSR